MKKSERLECIKKIVLENAIETQKELVELLQKEGVRATQATISRDINEIGIGKVPTADGRYIYGLPKESPQKQVVTPAPIKATILAVSDKISGLEQLLHLDVVPGNSRLIKRLLLEDFSDIIFSLIADDDSLLLVAKTPADADLIRSQVRTWMKS